MSHHCVKDTRMKLWPYQRGSRLAAAIVGVGPAVPIGRRTPGVQIFAILEATSRPRPSISN